MTTPSLVAILRNGQSDDGSTLGHRTGTHVRIGLTLRP